jgi:hypothetical protein
MTRRGAIVGLLVLGIGPAFALYDPKPDEALSAVQGEWLGSLTYRDYSEPKRLVTLPTRLFVALGAPDELVLSYVFDDGPAKTVFSYEKMRFNATAHQVSWSSGPDAKVAVYDITSDTAKNSVRTLVFEQRERGELKRFTMSLSAHSLTLAEDEVDSSGVQSFRNKYEFVRPRT